MFSNVKPSYFRRRFESARQASSLIKAATSEYDTTPAARGTKYYLAEDGAHSWGYAVRPDGELVYVFSTHRGKGDSIVTDAIERGAVYGDCFDGYLTRLYVRNGFRVVDTVPNWTKGGPDVVLIALPGYFSRHGVEEH